MKFAKILWKKSSQEYFCEKRKIFAKKNSIIKISPKKKFVKKNVRKKNLSKKKFEKHFKNNFGSFFYIWKKNSVEIRLICEEKKIEKIWK